MAGDIEQAALRLFAERGFHEVTVDNIAAAADISTRTFFRYFANKEEVLLSDQRRRTQELLDALAGRPPHESALAALRNTILSTLSRFEEERDAVLMRTRIILQTPGLLARDQIYQASLTEPIINMVALRLGVDPATDLMPGVIVRSTLAATGVAFRMWCARGGEGNLATLVAEAIDLLDEGLHQASYRLRAATGGSSREVPRR